MQKTFSFRLLSEYHFFLSDLEKVLNKHFKKCFRLLSEYHFFLFSNKFIIFHFLIVSVSSQSIISSYKKIQKILLILLFGFRLLSEYHFFLYSKTTGKYRNLLSGFPSPLRVSFLLILPQQIPYFIIYHFIIFVRILKIFIFLFLNNKKYTLTPIFKVSWRLLKKIIIFVFNFI